MKMKLPKLPIATAVLALTGLTILPNLQAVTTAVTTPVGYHTLNIISAASTVFNPVGVNFSTKILAAGDIDDDGGAPGLTANLITDAAADFTNAFTGVSSYDFDEAGGPDPAVPNLFIEITSGANLGANTEVTGFTGTTLTTNDDLSTLVSVGDTYSVRELTTIAGIFGAANEAGLFPNATSGLADQVWLPVGSGFSKVFYHPGGGFPSTTPGWYVVGQSLTDSAANHPIYVTASMIIERRASQPTPLALIVSGHVRTKATSIAVETGFSFFDRLFPVGATLGNSGLVLVDGSQNPIGGLSGGSANTADIVWLPDGAGGYEKFYYETGAGFPGKMIGWQLVGGADALRNGEPLPSGIVVERKGAPLNLNLTPDPAIYSNL